jgi:iron complex outermembrane recepter protein
VLNSKYFTTSSVIALACFAAAPAFAQATTTSATAGSVAAAAGDPALEVVVVTAQKRSENLQDTPISISVLGAQGLENRNIQSLVDLGDGAIPSLKVAPFFSRPGALIMNIRGIGVLSDSNQPARDQGVGVYVDGVYLGRPQGLGTALYDVESIEVLKGPQGTLFGRNTEGGAVNIVTKKPSGKFRLTAVAGAGNFGSYKSEFRLDLPRWNGLSVKLDAVTTARDGWVDNPLAGASDFGSFRKRGFRGAVLWEPTTKFSAEYAYDNGFDATSTNYFQLVEAGTLRLSALGTPQPKRAKAALIGVPQQESLGKTWGHRLGLDWNITEDLRVKSITSYRDLTQGQFDNANAPTSQFLIQASGVFTGQGFARYSLARFTQDQVSQEFQLIGETERLKYVAGVLYYQENVEDNAQAFNTAQFTDAIGSTFNILSLDYTKQRIDRASRVKTTSKGVFGQATYNPAFMDGRFHLTLGGRYTQDTKEGRLFTVNGALPVVNGVSGARILNETWDRFDPLVNLSYYISDDVMVYGKYSSGYKSGGANSRSLFYSPFNPEVALMYEVGAKIEFFNRRARLNLAAYTGTYEDIQLDFSAQYAQNDPVTGALLTTLRTTTETTNAPGDGKLKGFEADLMFAVTDRLTFTAGYAYNSVEIPATVNPFRQSNGQLITVPIPIYQVYTPETSGSFALDYDQPFFGATLLAHIDANFDSGYYANYTDVAYDPITRAVTVPQPKGEKSALVNARLAITDVPVGDGMATFSLWSRNLLNEEHQFYVSKSVPGGVSSFFNEPRTFGLEVKVKM